MKKKYNYRNKFLKYFFNDDDDYDKFFQKFNS